MKVVYWGILFIVEICLLRLWCLCWSDSLWRFACGDVFYYVSVGWKNIKLVISLFSAAPPFDVRSRVHSLQRRILIHEGGTTNEKNTRFSDALLDDDWVSSWCPKNENTKFSLRYGWSKLGENSTYQPVTSEISSITTSEMERERQDGLLSQIRGGFYFTSFSIFIHLLVYHIFLDLDKQPRWNPSSGLWHTTTSHFW